LQQLVNLPIGVKVSLPSIKLTVSDQTAGTLTNGSTYNLYASPEGLAHGVSDIQISVEQGGQRGIDGRYYDAIMLVSGSMVVKPWIIEPNEYGTLLDKNSNQAQFSSLDESVAADTPETTLESFSSYFFTTIVYDFDISESSSGTSPLDAYIALIVNGNVVVRKVAGLNGYPRIGRYEIPTGTNFSNATIKIVYANKDSVAHNFHIVVYGEFGP
jgi:hypothetical protein